MTLVVGSLLVLVFACAPARQVVVVGGIPMSGSEAEFAFAYDGSVPVNDLHVEFNTPVDNVNYAPFPNVASLDDAEKTYTYYGANLSVGDTATIRVKSKHPSRGKLAVVKWWWTKDDERVGPEHKGNP
jgi:hypothetical protein